MKISQKTDTMTHLIEEILMFSKLERNKIVFHTTPVNLDSYLQETLTAIAEDYSEPSLMIHFEPNAKDAMVSIDCI